MNGGAIAIGHPIGASGTRITGNSTTSNEKTEMLKKVLLLLCIGGGMGIALCVER